SAGQTTGSANYYLQPDGKYTGPRTLTVKLSPLTCSAVGPGSADTTIVHVDDAETPPTLSINDVSVTEGNVGTTNATFTVTMSSALQIKVSVNYSTNSGSAQAGSDFTPQSGTLNLAAGETTKQIAVPVYGDTDPEPNETFTVVLSNPSNGLVLTKAVGTGTIV